MISRNYNGAEYSRRAVQCRLATDPLGARRQRSPRRFSALTRYPRIGCDIIGILYYLPNEKCSGVSGRLRSLLFRLNQRGYSRRRIEFYDFCSVLFLCTVRSARCGGERRYWVTFARSTKSPSNFNPAESNEIARATEHSRFSRFAESTLLLNRINKS